MANNQNVNKVVYGNTTLIDLTGDDVTAADVRSGKKFHLKSGAQGTGSLANGSAATPTTSITSTPTISVSSAGLITASHSASKSITPSVSAGYISSGTAGTVSTSGSATQQLTTKAAATLYPSTSDQTISSGQYLTGTQTIKAVTTTNLTADVIKSGVTVQVGDASDPDRITSVTGSYEGVDTSNVVMFGVSWTNGKYINGSGSLVTSSNFKYTSNYIPVNASKTYSLGAYKGNSGSIGVYIAYYNGTTFLNLSSSMFSSSGAGNVSGSFTTPENCTQIKLSVGKQYSQFKIT